MQLPQLNPPLAPPVERPPAPVRRAVLVMYAGAAGSLIGAAAYLANWYFHDYVPATRPGIVHGDSGVFISGSPVFAWFFGLAGLVVFCLWLWMARMCWQGHHWARVTATVLLALQAFTAYRALYRWAHFGVSQVGWTGLVPVVSFCIGCTAVILLWQRSAAPYFRAARR